MAGGFPPNPARICSQGTGSLFQFWIKAGQGIANDADDDGRVVKDMCDQDRAECPNKWDRRGTQSQHLHEARLTQPRGPSRALNPAATTTVGSMNGTAVRARKQGLAAKIKAGKKISSRQSDKKGDESGKNRLVKSKE